jgi:hypothetical protein
VSEFKNIEELFKSELQNHEVPVRAELWNKVASASGIVKPRFWTTGKIAAASVLTLTLGAAVLWFLPKSQNQTTSNVAIEQHEETNPNQSQGFESKDQQLGNENQLLKEKESSSNALNQETSTNKDIASKSVEYSPRPKNNSKEKSTVPPFADAPIGGEVAPVAIEKTEHDGTDSKSAPSFTPETSAKEAAVQNEDVLDLKTLQITTKQDKPITQDQRIAPPKEETVSLEQIHFPEPFVKIFNPNVSGESGSFSVLSKDLGTFKIEISNRSGKRVYESNDPNFVWRGEQMDGSLAPEGTYVYSVFATTNSGEPLKPQSGSVFLMRR